MIISSTGAATFSSSVNLGANANGADTALLNIKQAGASYNQGIYIERGGERNGYHMYIGGALDSLTFRRNYFGTQSDVMSLTRDGNVGIGTASPSDKLVVNGNLGVTDGSFASGESYSIYIGDKNAFINSTFGQKIKYGAFNGFDFGFAENGDLSLSSTWMSINGSGNVGIGTASPTKRLDVRASVAGEVVIISNDRNSAGDYGFVTSLGSNCNNTSAYHYIAATGGSDRVYIFGNGNIQNTNNSYGGISDAKLKENITDASPKLEDLLKVKVRNYNLIGEETKQIGVIAQELEEVFPSMIDESEDFEEVEVPQLDEEGNEMLNEEGEVVTIKQRVSKGTSTKSVKYSVFVPMLIKAIQELKTEIDSLKNQIK
jgi:hypothetical protein